LHDRQTKFRWYGEFGVANYWVLDAYQRTLECFILERDGYRLDCSANGTGDLKPAAFSGLTISLATLWDEQASK
jgi:Uma2 family endonuclease